MPRSTPPKYSLHKATGQARVRIDGKDIWLGRYGSPESLKRYADELDRWQKSTEVAPHMTVGQLTLIYSRWASKHYVKNGQPTSKLHVVQAAMKALNQSYRKLPAAELSPKKFVAVRDRLIERGTLARSTINDYMGVIRRMVKWAVAEEILPAERLVALQAVRDLQRGRTVARETKPVRPVSMAFVNAIESHIPRPLWGVIQFQLATGARPGEALIVRGIDLDMSGEQWLYRPESHKLEHHGRERVICLGPQAQGILREFLSHDLHAYVFGPERFQGRQPYRRDSYATALRRACEAAGVPQWHANQLRHCFATRARKEFGLEAARVTLGHSKAITSEIYAERDLSAAAAVVAKIG